MPHQSPDYARPSKELTTLRIRTFGSVLDASKGFGPGFDFMRVFLALSVLAWHCVQLSQGNLATPQATPLWFVDYSILPMFFGLSGFLVAGSGQRLSLKNFLINRGLRIIPALAVEVLFSAFVLGAIFTILPLRQYFTSFETWHYLTNMVGIINYYLPGVFTTNPVTQVNYALWTVPYEIGCYVLMSFLMITGWLRAPRVVFLSTLCLMLLAVVIQVTGLRNHSPVLVAKFLSFAFLNGAAKLFPCFLVGVLFYQFRYRIPYHPAIFLACIVGCIALAVFGNTHLNDVTALHLIGVPVLLYIVVFAGLSKLPKLPVYKHGDYSYGIYLYHVPFLQAIVFLHPEISAGPLFIIGLPLMTAVAALSWHFIEKPILAQRKRFSFVARERGVADAPALSLPESHPAIFSTPAEPKGA